MANAARERFRRPVWKDDSVVQLHIDYRCIRGGRTALETAKDTFATAVKVGRGSRHYLFLMPKIKQAALAA